MRFGDVRAAHAAPIAHRGGVVGLQAIDDVIGLDVDDRPVGATSRGNAGGGPLAQRQTLFAGRNLRQLGVPRGGQRCAAGVDDRRVGRDPQILDRLEQQPLGVVDYRRAWRAASARACASIAAVISTVSSATSGWSGPFGTARPSRVRA